MIDQDAVSRETFAVRRAAHELATEEAILAGLALDTDPLERARWELSVCLAEAALSGARRRLRDAEAGWEPRAFEPEPVEEERAAA